MRIVISLAVVSVLMVLAVAGPCLGCSAPNPDIRTAGSCCHHGGCEKPTRIPARSGCDTLDAGLAAVGQTSAQIAYDAAATATPVIADRAALVPFSPPTFSDPYSPPHIYLLNSVLIV